MNPHQLINYGITSLELYDAIAKSNINVGGDVITKSSQAYVVRGIGLINDLEEIRNIVVKEYQRYACIGPSFGGCARIPVCPDWDK